MAAYTWSQLRTLVKQQADIEESEFVGTTGNPNELDHYLNQAHEELYNELIAGWGDESFVTSSALTATAGTPSYDLQGVSVTPALSEPALKICQVLLIGTDDLIPLRPYSLSDTRTPVSARTDWRQTPPRYRTIANRFIAFDSNPSAAHSLIVTYIPQVTKFSLTSNSTDTVPELMGYAEYLVTAATIRCLMKEESDTSQWEARRMTLLTQMKANGPPRDMGQPQGIRDLRAFEDGQDPAQMWWR